MELKKHLYICVYQTNKIVEIMEFAICSKCGASIKYPVTISGKIYGTSCAETVLGGRLPKGFAEAGEKPDAGQWMEYQQQKMEKNRAIIQKQLKETKRDWHIQQYLSDCYFLAKNDWERGFVMDMMDRLGSHIIDPNHPTDFESVKERDTYFHSYVTNDLNSRFEKLSPKQKSILGRIKNN